MAQLHSGHTLANKTRNAEPLDQWRSAATAADGGPKQSAKAL